jgi:drug/metabolite transporter (DMT)-like permease
MSRPTRRQVGPAGGSKSPSAHRPAELAAPPPLDALLLVVAVVGVSFSGPLMAATAAPALAIAFWRNAMGAGVTTLVTAVRHLPELRALTRRAVFAAAAGGLALAAHFGTWVPSVTMTSVASATALVSTQTIFVALIAHCRGRTLPAAAWVGIAVAIAGTALITGADVGVSARALIGDGLALIGGFAAAVYVTIGSVARRRMTTATYTTVCYTVCALVLLTVCAIGGVPLHGYPADAWVKLVLVTVSAQLLGHSLINLVLRTTSPTVVSLAILFETPGAAIVAFVWLGQRPPWTALPGFVLLLSGLVLVARSRGSDAPVEAVE